MYGTVRYRPAASDDAGRVVYRGAWLVDCDAHVAEKLKRWFMQIATSREGTLAITATRETARDLLWMIERFPMAVDDVVGGRMTSRRSTTRCRPPWGASSAASASPATGGMSPR